MASRSSSTTASNVPIKDIEHHFEDTLFQFFYVFGIEPVSLNIQEFTKEKKYLLNDFKETKLLTKFPPSGRIQADIDQTTLICHCFPSGCRFVESDTRPKEEYFFFELNNLLSLSDSDKILYFVCAIIYEPLISYLEIKYKNVLPNVQNKSIDIKKIYVQKALCLSSYCSFPTEVKNLLAEIIKYSKSDKITLPLELILENIIFGIPRPLRMYFFVFCPKTNGIIPGQTKDIEFTYRDLNRYNSKSIPLQQIIMSFSTKSIMMILYCILTEMPILFFSRNKEQLATIIEGFLLLIQPFEYQCPCITILPDCMSGLIEIEKSFIFGINRAFEFKYVNKIATCQYFLDMHLNVYRKTFLIVDIEKSLLNVFCSEVNDYHVVNLKDLGIYSSNPDDPLSILSRDAYNGKVSDISTILQFPNKYANKITTKIEAFKKDNKNITPEYTDNNKIINKRIGFDFFYYFMASLFLDYHSYLFNGEEEVRKVFDELKSKRYDEIKIEKLFMVEKFEQDHKSELDFYPKFLRTKIFKNFMIRKYLSEPFDRYTFLCFDEQISEKKNKGMFSKKIKTSFIKEEFKFQINYPYNMRPSSKKNFSEQELAHIKNNKEIVSMQYYQDIVNDNKIKYTIFPKLLYDDKFFTEKYKNSIDFSKDQSLIKLLQNYHELEDFLLTEKSESYFDIYRGLFVHRHQMTFDKSHQVDSELIVSLYQLWLIIFALTFHYFDESEKIYRFEELMRKLNHPNAIDNDKRIISLLLTVIKDYGNEEMAIKLFEQIKDFYYSHFSCLVTKLKSNRKLKWDEKKIEIANEKVNIVYYREPIVYDKQTTESIDNIKKRYKHKIFRKRTFYTGKEKVLNQNRKENIYFEMFYNCPNTNCKNNGAITDIVKNLEKMSLENKVFCSKCKKKMPILYHVIYNDQEKIEFKLYPVTHLLKIVKSIMKKYGTKIEIDELREKYKDFFWNCILYFNFNNFDYEILLKYRDTIPQLNSTFQICRQ